MNLLYVCMYQFYIDSEGVYTLPAFGDDFWKKYLAVFDEIHIIGEPIKGYLNKEKLVKLNTTFISIELLPANNSPQDWKNDRIIRNRLKEVIPNYDAIIIKPASRKGIIAIKIAEMHSKKYIIEITGDLHTALKHHSNLLKRLYAPIIYKQIKRRIKNCQYGVYVTDKYLQKKYPVCGKTCGASDAVIKEVDDIVLERRIGYIKSLTNESEIRVGLVGFYHDANKGIDTAIDAISYLKNKRVKLFVLGNGNKSDKAVWYKYAKKKGVFNDQLIFPEPIIGIDNMYAWYDSMSIIILPSRSEGLPRTIVEAMSRGCPCITSNVCGLSELCEERWTHDAGDSRRLSVLIDYMISDSQAMISASAYNHTKSKYYLEEKQLRKRICFMNEYKDSISKEIGE